MTTVNEYRKMYNDGDWYHINTESHIKDLCNKIDKLDALIHALLQNEEAGYRFLVLEKMKGILS